ncbi:glycoside hydrolase family 36 protein [Mangrovibacterium diazotrophicum]|uniref:Melibiase n=1 Tax=Mangrovibacterium diazotrophicum TaxID=1261403 RepID=A0A419W8Y2_9BACT|nr:glycoside hydrolase family 36 protein [Mangrovibacterium diazotrophicum]RKD91900.1 melibiase [Mangrovibacterium diazotrophicum]
MPSKRIERRSFIKLLAAGVGASLMPIRSLADLSVASEAPGPVKFKLGRSEWILHNDGTFDLISGAIRLRNCRPTIDGQSIFVQNTFMGDSPKGKRIIYELAGNSFVMLDLKIFNGSVSIGIELSNMSRAPFYLAPLGEARVEGVDRFFKQGIGQGGPSGIYDIPTPTAEDWGNTAGEQAWSYDSYLTTGLLSPENETLAFAAYDHYDFTQKSTIYNRPHRKGLYDRYPDKEEIYFETGFVMENIPLKNEFIKLPDIYIVKGNTPFDTLQHIAWNISENMVARKDTKTSYHWNSWYEYQQHFSFDQLKEVLQGFDELKPKIPLQTIQIDDCYCVLGDWLETNERWPRTMEDAAREIFQRGYRAGIWVAPFVVDENSKLFKSHPNWIIRDLDGEPILQHNFRESNLYALDGSHPEVQKYIARVFRTFRKMGFTFYKTAYLEWGLKDSYNIRRYDRDKTSVQILVDVMKIIREEIGAGAYWMASNAPFAPLIGFVDGMRISANVDADWTPGGIGNMFQESYNCQYFNNVFWQNDPDTIFLRNVNNNMSDAENRSIALWDGILGGTVNTSDRFSTLTEAQLDLWRFLQPQDRPQSALIPLWSYDAVGKVAVRRYKSEKAWGILIVNDTDEAFDKTYRMEDLTGESKCWIFRWGPEESMSLGQMSDIQIKLDSHESILLYAAENNDAPASDLSISGVKLDKYLKKHNMLE